MAEKKSTYVHKENRGTIFDNDRKTTEKHPDFSGSCNIEGTDYFVSGWAGTANGKRKLSLSFKRKDMQSGQEGGSSEAWQNDGWGAKDSTQAPVKSASGEKLAKDTITNVLAANNGKVPTAGLVDLVFASLIGTTGANDALPYAQDSAWLAANFDLKGDTLYAEKVPF